MNAADIGLLILAALTGAAWTARCLHRAHHTCNTIIADETGRKEKP